MKQQKKKAIMQEGRGKMTNKKVCQFLEQNENLKLSQTHSNETFKSPSILELIQLQDEILKNSRRDSWRYKLNRSWTDSYQSKGINKNEIAFKSDASQSDSKKKNVFFNNRKKRKSNFLDEDLVFDNNGNSCKIPSKNKVSLANCIDFENESVSFANTRKKMKKMFMEEEDLIVFENVDDSVLNKENSTNNFQQVREINISTGKSRFSEMGNLTNTINLNDLNDSVEILSSTSFKSNEMELSPESVLSSTIVLPDIEEIESNSENKETNLTNNDYGNSKLTKPAKIKVKIISNENVNDCPENASIQLFWKKFKEQSGLKKHFETDVLMDKISDKTEKEIKEQEHNNVSGDKNCENQEINEDEDNIFEIEKRMSDSLEKSAEYRNLSKELEKISEQLDETLETLSSNQCKDREIRLNHLKELFSLLLKKKCKDRELNEKKKGTFYSQGLSYEMSISQNNLVNKEENESESFFDNENLVNEDYNLRKNEFSFTISEEQFSFVNTRKRENKSFLENTELENNNSDQTNFLDDFQEFSPLRNSTLNCTSEELSLFVTIRKRKSQEQFSNLEETFSFENTQKRENKTVVENI